jgi:hypothetical protein
VVTSLYTLVCMLILHGSSYLWGEGALCVVCRPRLAFPPSYLFELHGLESWVILLLGLCYLFLGHNPVQVLLIYKGIKHKTEVFD